MTTWVVEVEAERPERCRAGPRLRTGTPAVMGRLRDGKLVLDVRTIFPHQEDALVEAVQAALRANP